MKDFVRKGFADAGTADRQRADRGRERQRVATRTTSRRAEPTPPIKRGDWVLLDMWAKLDQPGAVYYDITWTAFCGDQPTDEMRERVRPRCATRATRHRAGAGRDRRSADTLRGFEVDDACRAVIVKARIRRILHASHRALDRRRGARQRRQHGQFRNARRAARDARGAASRSSPASTCRISACARRSTCSSATTTRASRARSSARWSCSNAPAGAGRGGDAAAPSPRTATASNCNSTAAAPNWCGSRPAHSISGACWMGRCVRRKRRRTSPSRCSHRGRGATRSHALAAAGVAIAKAGPDGAACATDGTPLMADLSEAAVGSGRRGVGTEALPASAFYGLGPRTDAASGCAARAFAPTCRSWFARAGMASTIPARALTISTSRAATATRSRAGDRLLLLLRSDAEGDFRRAQFACRTAPSRGRVTRRPLRRLGHAEGVAAADRAGRDVGRHAPMFNLAPYNNAPPELQARARQLGSLVARVSPGTVGLSGFPQAVRHVLRQLHRGAAGPRAFRSGIRCPSRSRTIAKARSMPTNFCWATRC